jgi:glycine/D-amino acid oxidase-like deaminating enzyme
MKINHSPWIEQLRKDRPSKKLSKDESTDIAIIGGGIAGISTAFFILKRTDKKVLLVEKSRLAYGATGHNAGQIVSYFEKPFHVMTEEFGVQLAGAAQKSIELSWELLEEMYTEAGLTLNLSRFTGYDGFSTFEQVEEALKSNAARKEAGLSIHEISIAKESALSTEILSKYDGLYLLKEKKEILSCLETEDESFIAMLSEQKGVTNSALFTEELSEFLLKTYPERFTIYEHTLISKVVLKEDHVLLAATDAVITAKKVVLCTNGFENIEILNQGGMAIDTRFHHNVNGVVARMSGYLEKKNKSPTAISYYVDTPEGFDDMDQAYFYLTRRPFEHESDEKHNLICVGGPQHAIADREEYLSEFDYPEAVQKEVEDFVKTVYDPEPNTKIDYKFTWHGLMGYTPNGVRLIGAEPLNPVLLYNLGCNGVGILPSIYGGSRIARIIAGEKLEPSIFDPKSTKGILV